VKREHKTMLRHFLFESANIKKNVTEEK
jgi:hypothetical protein